MKSLLFSTVLYVLLPVLLAQNMCYTCRGVNSQTCPETEEKCTGNECMTIYETLVLNGKTSTSFYKRCADNFPCNQSAYLYNPHSSLNYKIDCCKGDLCNTGSFNMTQEDPDKQAEGMICPSCFANNTLEGCNATESLVCLAKEDMCVKIRGTVKPPGGEYVNISSQGCASSLACKLDKSALIAVRIPFLAELQCSNPKSEATQEQGPRDN